MTTILQKFRCWLAQRRVIKAAEALHALPGHIDAQRRALHAHYAHAMRKFEASAQLAEAEARAALRAEIADRQALHDRYGITPARQITSGEVAA